MCSVEDHSISGLLDGSSPFALSPQIQLAKSDLAYSSPIHASPPATEALPQRWHQLIDQSAEAFILGPRVLL